MTEDLVSEFVGNTNVFKIDLDISEGFCPDVPEALRLLGAGLKMLNAFRHLAQEGHGFDEVQVFGLVASALEPVVCVSQTIGEAVNNGNGFQESLKVAVHTQHGVGPAVGAEPGKGLSLALEVEYLPGLFG